MKIKVVLPATIVCLLPWLLNGLPTDANWLTAFIICIAIDLYIKFNKRHEDN